MFVSSYIHVAFILNTLDSNQGNCFATYRCVLNTFKNYFNEVVILSTHNILFDKNKESNQNL